MGTVTTMATPKILEALARMYADLGWSAERQAGFNRRCCGYDRPRTTADANKVYQGLEAMLMRLIQPYYGEFTGLVQALVQERYRMTPWERDTFLLDVIRKMAVPGQVSPKMVKKTREIAHKYGVPCGFPAFRELSAAHDRKERTDDGSNRHGSHVQNDERHVDRVGQPEGRAH